MTGEAESFDMLPKGTFGFRYNVIVGTDIDQVPLGLDRDIYVRKHKETGKLIFYLYVDVKAEDEVFHSRRLSPAKAKEIINAYAPEEWAYSKNREGFVEHTKQGFIKKYINASSS